MAIVYKDVSSVSDRTPGFRRLRALHRDPEEDPKTRDDIYKACNFDSIVADVTDKPFLPERSLDFVVSNCVLSHIPPSELSRMGG